jgi:uncharacterized membrane protein YdbT with pleckstrin-like domain
MIAAMNEETLLWKGSPSQWLNVGPFTLGLLLGAAIITGGCLIPLPPVATLMALLLPLGYMMWKYLVVRAQVFELTSERLRVTRGVINQQVDEIELYRIKDSALLRIWWMRLTGVASVSLETSDRTMPKLIIPAIRGGMEMRELLRKQVEAQRDQKRVREMDFDESAGGDSAGDSVGGDMGG